MARDALVPIRSRLGRSLAVVLLGGGAAWSCSQEAPPAYPSALVTIDTDLPVPSVISRLAVDVFNAEGKWIEQRQFTFTSREEWPASFGVVMRDDTRSTDVLLRIRAFVGERDYLGERFVPRVPFVPKPVATSLAQLCKDAPVLPHRDILVQRAGDKPLFEKTCGDSGTLVLDNATGSVAAHVDIPQKGRYRFEVVTSLLASMETYAFGSSLHLAKNCLEPEATTLACSHAIATQDAHFGKVELDLDPGRYTLITASSLGGSVGNVALRWAESSQWDAVELPPAEAPVLVERGAELTMDPADGVTPTTEPSPDSAVDRLVRLHLELGNPLRPRVLLTGACAGTMAKLAVQNNRVDAAKSETCINDATKLEPAPWGATPFDVGAGAGSQRTSAGTFALDACTADDSDDDVACVPGGAFVLGSATERGLVGAPGSSPVRIVATSRFFIDRDEVTVGRYRKAFDSGLEIPEAYLPYADDRRARATFSDEPKGREDLPLNFIMWQGARKICQHFGGDLPTEAQWERAASFDPDRGKRRFPWGDEEPTCDRTVYGRADSFALCRPLVTLPFAVTSKDLEGDVSFLGIRGLAGNVSEWVLGSPRRYDDPCWRATTVIDPVCFDPNDSARSERGGAWTSLVLAVALRSETSTAYSREQLGFRCAYAERPARR